MDDTIEITDEQRARHYAALGHSVDTVMQTLTLVEVPGVDYSERYDHVRRNVQHLEIMLAKDFWIDEDMTLVESTINAGNAYLDARAS